MHRVKIVEVGPRDGLQNIKNIVPFQTKVDLIQRLAKTGLQAIEATSFVSPKWVPQLSDSSKVMQAIQPLLNHPSITFPVLVPNMKGLLEASQAGAKEIGIFLSATEGFSRKNINCSIEESLRRVDPVVTTALDKGIRVRAYISCIVDCPYDGRTSPSQVLHLAKKLLALGCFEISLGDTTGAATPADVRILLDCLLKEIPASKLAGHFHDTFGQAVANVLVAYEMGIRTFDSSVSGLGGCPYSPGAKGNVATEDIVYLFQQMQVETGVDLAMLADVGQWIAQQLKQNNGSHAGAALISRRASTSQSISLQSRPKPVVWQLLQETEALLVHRNGATLRITMNRPKNGNTLTSSMIADLINLFRDSAKDKTCFRIVLTGSGKYFCTGMDLKNATPGSRKQNFLGLRDLFDTIDTCSKTTIAVINGPAFGGDVGLAFACDIRLASKASVFQLTEVRLGICPAVISKVVLREWGLSFAREAMLSARPVSAQELFSKIGAVHLVCPSEEEETFQAAVDTYILDLRWCAPGGMGLVKQLAETSWKHQGSQDQEVNIERIFDTMMTSEEQRIGMAAFAKGVRKTDWEEEFKSRRTSKL
ncbi:pyruvate carboxyltransferase, partial [Aureobasidium melanogenum]